MGREGPVSEPTWGEWDAITTLFVNVGFGSAVGGALIWFLMHLVKVTLPQQQQAFMQALKAEQDTRRDNTDRLVRQLVKLMREVRRGHTTTLDRIDVAFKQLVAEVMAARAERHAGGWTGPRPKDGTDDPHQ